MISLVGQPLLQKGRAFSTGSIDDHYLPTHCDLKFNSLFTETWIFSFPDNLLFQERILIQGEEEPVTFIGISVQDRIFEWYYK